MTPQDAASAGLCDYTLHNSMLLLHASNLCHLINQHCCQLQQMQQHAIRPPSDEQHQILERARLATGSKSNTQQKQCTETTTNPTVCYCQQRQHTAAAVTQDPPVQLQMRRQQQTSGSLQLLLPLSPQPRLAPPLLLPLLLLLGPVPRVLLQRHLAPPDSA
jgi:hypothetical protein